MTKVITENRIFQECYDRQERERALITRRWKELPNNQMAVMTAKQAREYLGVCRTTLERYHSDEILIPMINPKNGYKYYLLGHLWVFKLLWLERDD